MKTDQIPPTVKGVGIGPSGNPKTRVLVLLTTDNEKHPFVIGPSLVEELVRQLIANAAEWSHDDLQQTADPGTHLMALPTGQVEIARGREPTEAAMSMFCGPIRLNFLVPTDVLVPAAVEFLSSIEQDGHRSLQ